MKTACLILVMVGCAMMPSNAFGSASNLAPQQSPENSTTAGSDRPSDTQHAVAANERTHQNDGTSSGEQRDRLHSSGKPRARSHATLIKAHAPKQFQNGREALGSKNLAKVQRPGSSRPFFGREKFASNRTPPIRPATGSAMGGQQLNNARNRAAAAVIGGPADAIRNRGTLSGNSTSRKHRN